jgi:tetratricopeptide (TPR) repeat protein
VSGGPSVNTTSSGAVTYLRISGAIDGELDIEKIRDATLTPVAVLNLRGVNEVTDDGARKWQEAIAAVGGAVEELILVECSPAVVARMNEDPAFVGKAAVASAQIGMSCTACGRAATPTIDVDIPITDETLEFACAECSAEMAPMSDAPGYFDFCHRVPTTSLSQDVQIVVNIAERPSGPPTLEPGSEEQREYAALAEAIAAAEAEDAARDQAELESAPEPETGKKGKSRSTREGTEAPAAERKRKKRRKKAKARPRQPARETEERTVVEPPVEAPIQDPTEVAMSAFDDAAAPPDDGPADEGTDPNIRLASIQSLEGEVTTPGKRPDAAGMPTIATAPGDKLLIGAAGVIVALVLVIILLLMRGPTGIPPEVLLAFHDQLEAGDLEAAEAVLAEQGDSIPNELRVIAEDAIGELRAKEVAATLEEASGALARKDYAEAAKGARAALEIDATNADGLFIAGESLRLLGRLVEAAEYYATFIEEHPDDARLDDALFWKGESLLTQGKLHEARPLFERVVALEQSDFARSAARRIEQIDAEAPPAPEPQDDGEAPPDEDAPEPPE